MAAYSLNQHDYWIKDAIEERKKAADVRKDPDKEWTEFESVKDPLTGFYHSQEVNYVWKKDADLLFDEDAAESEKNADFCDEHYQK